MKKKEHIAQFFSIPNGFQESVKSSMIKRSLSEMRIPNRVLQNVAIRSGINGDDFIRDRITVVCSADSILTPRIVGRPVRKRNIRRWFTNRLRLAMFAISLLLALAASAQTYMSIGAGYSATKQAPVAELNVGHNLKGLLFQAGYIAHINRRDAAVFNIRTGAAIGDLYLTAGPAWQIVSNDYKERNLMSYIVGAEYRLGIATISIQHTDGHLFVVGGVRYYFND